MAKVLRFSIPFILAFLFLGFFFYIGKASSQAITDLPPFSIQGTIAVNT
jgi:hypothetical protein